MAPDERPTESDVVATPTDGLSEWEQLVAAATLHIGRASPAELDEDQIAALAAATGRDPRAVVRLSEAHRLGQEIDVSVEIVFALLHTGLPADKAALAATSEETQRRAVAKGIAAGIVPADVGRRTDAAVAGLKKLAVEQPVFLADPEALYSTTSDAAVGQSDAAKLVNARLNAALRERVEKAVGRVSPEFDRALHRRLSGLRWRKVAETSIADVAASQVAAVGKDAALAEEAEAVRKRIKSAPRRLVAEALRIDAPVGRNPLLHGDVGRGKAVEYARLAGLDNAATRAVLERSGAVADGDATALAQLVAKGSLGDDDASALGAVLALARLTGDNVPLMRALDERSETAPPALVRKTREEWGRLLAEHQVPLPPGETRETYADAIVRNLELTYPTQALAARAGSGPVATFFENNPELDLRSVDLARRDGAQFEWKGIADEERPEVERQLKAFQRVIAIAPSTRAQTTLLDRGYDSALRIAAKTEREFIATSGLSKGEAKITYARAQEAALAVSHGYGAIADLVRGLFGDLAVGNVSPQLVNDLREIDGFSDLFGSQDFCKCEDCQSVLSPAAYFCDLMHFVEEHVSTPVFVEANQTGHPLYLKTRRPDLWTLELTCENTNTLVPYLTIVDEVLETFLGSIVGGDIYETLADPADKVSFRVPFSLPFAQLGLYLSHFGLSPADVYDTLELADGKVWRARLRLSPDEAAVVATPDPTGVLSRLGDPATLADYNVQDFLAVTGLERDELDSVLELRSNTDLQAIVVAKQKTDDDELQNFPEILQELTAERVDFIHRFLRLWRSTPWQIDELDLLLLALREGGLIGTDLDEAVIEQLGQLFELQGSLRLKVEELCALVDGLPVSADYPLQPADEADERLYERLFDLEALFGFNDESTGELEQSVAYRHYSLDTLDPTDTTVDPKTPLLLAGLGISETELLLLFDFLQDELPFDEGGNCALDRSKLSLLYRHVRVARALRLSVDDCLRALELLYTPGSQVLTSLQQVRDLIDFRAWLRSSPFTTSELRFVLAGLESPSVKYTNTPDTVAQLVLGVQALATTGRVDVLRAQLAALFNVTATRLDSTLAWISADIDASDVAAALDATFTDGVADNPDLLLPLVDLVQQLERVSTLFTNLKLADDSVDYLTSNPAALGIASLTALTLHDVQSLAFYRSLVTLRDDVEDQVQDALAAYLASGTVSPGDDRARLADLWQVDTSLVDSLVDVLPLPAAPIDALETLSEGLDLCATLGVNGYSLQKLGEDADYATLEAARDVALGSFAAKYEDETVRESKLEPYEDRVNVLKRDALCDYVMARRPDLKFRDRSEIYDYFLLDVEMSGCFRTSRVVCATSSVQLYVQRCLLNLEQSDPDLNPDIPDIQVDPSRVPADEWEWRKNYRVWEANRKVFLYPESYIDPDLRDDRTPIFDELADDLLQQKITTDTAQPAYERYMTRFAELAHLRVCGSYYVDGTYYFFARTQQDPPVFYYRTWDLTTWTSWQKIELAINAPYVSAALHLGRLYIFWVEAKTTEKTKIKDGSSTFQHYEVEVGLTYSFLTPEGKWAAPQKVPRLFPYVDEYQDEDLTPLEVSKTFLKSYPQVVGDELQLGYYNEHLDGYFYERELDLFRNRLRAGGGMETLTQASAVMLQASESTAELGLIDYDPENEYWFDWLLDSLVGPAETPLTEPFSYTSYDFDDPDRDYVMHYVQGAYPESVFAFRGQQYLVHEKPLFWPDGGLASLLRARSATSADGNSSANGFGVLQATKQVTASSLAQIILAPTPYSIRELVRLSTSRADTLGEILFSDGLETFLSLDTQMTTEKAFGITITDLPQLAPPADDPSHLDFDGSFGTYYRELFLHIPWLIAFHLNADQQFEDAMWWYARIFDPTASESSLDVTETDRNWRYAEFRNLTMPTLEEILTDSAAIEAYKTDPFNPFAIARLRPSAFQKAVVMHYVSNLLDWGDSLFAQDTMESINEATMLYVLASQILGKRPATLGDCETAADEDLTYEKIGPAIDAGSEFLVTLENWCYASTWKLQLTEVDRAETANARSKSASSAHALIEEATHAPLTSVRKASATLEAAPTLRSYASVVAARATAIDLEKAAEVAPPIQRWPAPALVPQCTLVFCVPQNDELLKYWDRVEDRLFKIRNCMNISGVRRSLALFAPPISPMALVRAKAAGLSLEEALAALAAPVPPYRFSYLVERARQATQLVQSFGGALLGALEKKDVEELTLLRSVHEQSIARMTKDVKTKQLEEAQFTLASLVEASTNVQKRIDYYQGLIDTGLTAWEVVDQVSKHVAGGFRIVENGLHLTSSILYLIPQAGSPFAMKYGGKETGDSLSAWATWAGSLAGISEAIAASAALEAQYQRREQDWEHQLDTARQDLAHLAEQRHAAATRVEIAEKELEIHETAMEHMQEVYEFFKDKFTNLGLYNYLATTLTRLHREAYNTAHDLAALAERAYRFETDDDTVFVAPDNWQFDRAGLLAGERLALQLQQLESAFLQQNTRRYEVTQSFSLALIDAGALLDLRETGSCEFSLPEVLFDLAYPGQYKRLIKAVRLTIPCVAGPYTNVSAKLTLKESRVRPVASVDPDDLVTLPLQTTPSIAASTAQNDGGLFELSFRDERYLPFEGAGAVSTWGLELPAQLRLFDYDSIADVIVHLSYTALDDGLLRATVESQLVDELTEYASTTGMFRLFSLRHDFPNAFQLLLHPTGTTQSADFELGSQHFPYFLTGRELNVAGVSLYVQPPNGTPVDTTGLKMTVNGSSAGTWSVPPNTTLAMADVAASGPALRDWSVKVTGGTLDSVEVGDVLLLVKYTVT